MKYNIEFAHIYADDVFNEEHIESVNILNKIINDRLKEHEYVTTVLIDEYNPRKDDMILDLNEFLNELSLNGANTDYVGFESGMVGLSDDVLLELDSKTRDKYLKYIKTRGKYPCSLLATTWYLLRFGALKNLNINDKIIKAVENMGINKFSAEKIITIIPNKYKRVEETVIKNIRNSKFSKLAKNIELIFYN
ncbi:hypothetical protein HGB13_03455 [bacterium]|nr:hypothetical protein [bacterium]